MKTVYFLLQTPEMTLEKDVAFLEIWTGSPDIKSAVLIERMTGDSHNATYYSSNNFMIIRAYTNSLQTPVDTFQLTYGKI